MISVETIFENSQAYIKKAQEVIAQSLLELDRIIKPGILVLKKAYAFMTVFISKTFDYSSTFLGKTSELIMKVIANTCAAYQFIHRKIYVWKILSVRHQWYPNKKGELYNPKLKATISPNWQCTWNLTRTNEQFDGLESKESAQAIAFKKWMKSRLLRKRLEEHNLAKKIPLTITQKIVANQKLLPNKIQLRNAVLKDTQEILNLMEQIGSLTSDPRFVVRIQTYLEKPNHHILVATKSKTVVGFIAFVIYDLFLSEGKRCRIEGMVVDAKQHDLSVKRKLMQAAELFARENNGKIIDMVDGSCRKKDGSHDFYKFLGYNNEGSMSKVYLRKEL